jgi:putative hydrolase of the HAD superfamily
VHVPHALTWVLEHVEEPANAARYRRVEDLGALPGLVARIG